MSDSRRSKYVVVEGIDGSGKSIATDAIVSLMDARGHECEEWKAPGHGSVGLFIRDEFAGKLNLTERSMMHLFVADAYESDDKIGHLLASGTSVVLDRHSCVSGLVYQRGNYPLRTCMEALNPRHMRRPDLLVYLRIDAQESILRRSKRRENQPDKVTDRKYTSDDLAKVKRFAGLYDSAVDMVIDDEWPKAVLVIQCGDSVSAQDIATKTLEALGIEAGSSDTKTREDASV